MSTVDSNVYALRIRILACVVMTDLVLAEEEVKVSCRSTCSCNTTGDDEIGLMTVQECCVENPSGLAYTMSSQQPGNGTCTSCIGELVHRICRTC